MMFFTIIALIILLIVPLTGREIDYQSPAPISGTPFFWNKTPRSIQTVPLAKPVTADTTFYIRQDLNAEDVTFIAVPFYRKYVDDKIAIYVEKAEFDAGRVSEEDITTLKQYLLDKTPPGSVNPQQGIYPNELELFGSPADKDHNGRLFVLLIDVRDGYKPGESKTYIAGYFDPLDQINHPDGKGNTGEIIYIDTNPAKVSDAMTLSVVAHELQHLIHHNYDTDESVWLLEGLSELAPRVLGLPTRSFGLFLGDTNRPLNNFDNSLTDYAKVGLWTFYIYQRFGRAAIKNVVQNSLNSLASYEKVLQDLDHSLTKDSLLEDWFIANLLNDTNLLDGRYSYQGAQISALSSSYFHSNFTGGTNISISLALAAAQYIQFYSGKQIQFNLQYPTSTGLKLAIVKHYATPVVNVMSLSSGSLTLQDADFGTTYSKITFIPFRTALTSLDEQLNLIYSASGIGGYSEQEIAYDNDQTKYYIQLQSYEAAEKFTGFTADAHLTAVKIKMYDNSPVTLRLYLTDNLTPILTLDNIIPTDASWTRIELPQPIALSQADAFYVAVSSITNSLGYCATEQGYQRAYCIAGTVFYNLRQFQVEGETLTGDWQIRAILSQKITRPAELVTYPDTLWFWQDEYSQSLTLSNRGTETLTWQVARELPSWLTITPSQGNLLEGSQQLEVNLDRNLLKPGIHNYLIPISSNGGEDTVLITIKEPNPQKPQAGLIPTYSAFSDKTGRLTLRFVNIGVGAAEFYLQSLAPAMTFYPQRATIPENDTLVIEAFLDRRVLQSRALPFLFFDGVDTLLENLVYQGTLRQERIYLLGEPFPNPFQPAGQCTLVLPVTLSTAQPFTLRIYNLRGEQIMIFYQLQSRAGLNILRWDGKNRYGQNVASGVYIVHLSVGNKSERRKIVVLN